MFLGTHTPRLDDKGRLFLPARFRDELAEGVVITKGQERCLYVFRRSDFERRSQDLAAAALTSRKARDYNRMLFATAFDDVPDRQGRVTVPAALRAYAGLERDCVVVGANSRLEIWDPQAWRSYEQQQEQAFADQDEEVLPGLG